jgi:hypothetical protein
MPGADVWAIDGTVSKNLIPALLYYRSFCILCL